MRRPMAPEFSFVSSPGVPVAHLFTRPARRQPNAVRFELHGVVDYHYDTSPSIALLPASLLISDECDTKRRKPPKLLAARPCRGCGEPFAPRASNALDCPPCGVKRRSVSGAARARRAACR